MQKTFTVFADPSHAWGKVPATVLYALGMKASSFSGYSYLAHGHMFLEEDADLTKFAQRYQQVTGSAPKWREKHCEGQSAIRFKPRNTPHNAWQLVPAIAL